MKTLAVTISHLSKERLSKFSKSGTVTKAVLRDEFRKPVTEIMCEFVTIGGYLARSGQYLTAREAIEQGIDMLEVRSDDHVNLIAAIYFQGGQAVVR